MKKLIIIFIFFWFALSSSAQHLSIGFPAGLGKLHIKGSQDTTQLVLQAYNNQSPQKSLLKFIKYDNSPLVSLNGFNENIWLGDSIGGPSAIGSKNIYIGKRIDQGSSGPTSSFSNVFIGDRAGLSLTAGNENIGIGKDALWKLPDASKSVCIGAYAGGGFFMPAVVNNVGIGPNVFNADWVASLGAGSNNIAMGREAMGVSSAASNSIAIGHSTLFGDRSLNGSGNSGGFNTALGGGNLYENKNGSGNVAIGHNSMRGNYSGNYNTAMGIASFVTPLIPLNTSNDNVALGYGSLYGGSGGKNTSIGAEALYTRVVYSDNVAIGYHASNSNSTGRGNSAVGFSALKLTSGADYNTAIGSQAGDTYNNNANNVFAGANTDVTGAGYYNVIALGQGTVVSGSSTARFGNSSTSSYGGWANWTNVSDGRFKTDVQENIPGLAFIEKLRPVTYRLQAKALDDFLQQGQQQNITDEARIIMNKAMAEKEKMTWSGFIAQEVEAAANSLHFVFSGVDKPGNDTGVYGLRYEEFVVPIVKAVQEQQQMLSTLDESLDKLNTQINTFKSFLQEIKKKQ